MPAGNYDRDLVLIHFLSLILKNGEIAFRDIKRLFPNITYSQYNRLVNKLKEYGFINKEGHIYYPTEKLLKLFSDRYDA